MQNYEEYIAEQIEKGYLYERTLEPLKCHSCDSEKLEDTGHIWEELGTYCLIEYKKACKDCGKDVGYWSYGSWHI